MRNSILSGLDVQLPSYAETGTGLLNILMYVPDEQRERVDKWHEDNFDRIDRWDWGVQIGDMVISPEPEKTDSFQYQFAGTVIGFRCAFAQVEDMSGDVFDIEPFRLAYMPRRGDTMYLDTIRMLVEQELPELSERYWARLDANQNSSKPK